MLAEKYIYCCCCCCFVYRRAQQRIALLVAEEEHAATLGTSWELCRSAIRPLACLKCQKH
jgi:hypothetical protein